MIPKAARRYCPAREKFPAGQQATPLKSLNFVVILTPGPMAQSRVIGNAMLKPWKPTLAKSAIAIAAPAVAVGVFPYHFYRLGLSGYVKELSQPDFLISQIVMVLAFAAWTARYSIPSVKFLSGQKF